MYVCIYANGIWKFGCLYDACMYIHMQTEPMCPSHDHVLTHTYIHIQIHIHKHANYILQHSPNYKNPKVVPGDQIVAIDGKKLEGKKPSEIRAMLSGMNELIQHMVVMCIDLCVVGLCVFRVRVTLSA